MSDDIATTSGYTEKDLNYLRKLEQTNYINPNGISKIVFGLTISIYTRVEVI